MAITPCDPCDCIGGNISDAKFKQDIEILLCAIRAGITTGTPTGSEATYIAGSVAGASGGVPTTGVKLITNTGNAKILSILNTLNVPVLISTNGGTTYGYAAMATNGVLEVDFGAAGLYTSHDIWAKAIGSNSASGTLYGMLTL